MPTGYTYEVAEGKVTELRDFAMRCARGMGALIDMRDERSDAPIPEKLKASTYHADHAKEDQAEIDEITAMTMEECRTAALAEQEREVLSICEYQKAEDAKAERYTAMIAKVEAWQGAPDGIKEFMLKQLRDSFEYDCRTTTWTAPKLKEPEEWRNERLDTLRKSLERHIAEQAADDARTAERQAWLDQLRESLK